MALRMESFSIPELDICDSRSLYLVPHFVLRTCCSHLELGKLSSCLCSERKRILVYDSVLPTCTLQEQWKVLEHGVTFPLIHKHIAWQLSSGNPQTLQAMLRNAPLHSKTRFTETKSEIPRSWSLHGDDVRLHCTFVLVLMRKSTSASNGMACVYAEHLHRFSSIS
jgi:hypothetical protein